MERYSENEDYLLALIAHLGLTSWKSRTTAAVARDTGLDHEKVESALAGFPGLFRVSRNSSEQGHDFYTLQIRFALRRPTKRQNEKAEDVEDAEDRLDRGQVIELMKFVANKAAVEREAASVSDQVAQLREASQTTVAAELQKMEIARTDSERALDVEIRKLEKTGEASRMLLEQGALKVRESRIASYLALAGALAAAGAALFSAYHR